MRAIFFGVALSDGKPVSTLGSSPKVSRAQRSMKRSGMMPPAFAGAWLRPGIVANTEFGTVPNQRCTTRAKRRSRCTASGTRRLR